MERACRVALEGALLGFAVWTLAYQLGLALGLPLLPVEVLAVVAGCATAVALHRWAPAAAAAVRTGSLIVPLGWSAAFALLSLLLRRPDADDVFFVGKSVFVAERGELLVADPVFSAGQLPLLGGNWPPVTAWEGLLGALARTAGVDAATVTHLWAPPVLAALAVLALDRLLVTWEVPRPGTALTGACVLLLWGGTHNGSFGNLHLGRIWQGKVLFLAVLVPLVLAVGTRWLRRRERRDLVLLLACSVAGVGLTTTAFIVLPLVAAAIGAAAAWRRDPRAVAGALSLAAYPLAVYLVTTILTRPTPLPPVGRPSTSGVLEMVVGSGPAAGLLLALTAVGVWSLRATGRLAAGAALLVAVVVTAPPVLGLLADLTGGGAVLWRVLWVVPVPALVGCGVAALAPPRGHPALRALPVVLALGLLAGTGRPLWSSENGAALGRPALKADPVRLASARALLAAAADGGDAPLLAPTGTSQALSLLTSRRHPVGSRLDYLTELTAQVPAFLGEQRLLLQAVADGAPTAGREAAVLEAMTRLDVPLACLPAGSGGERLLLSVGWTPAGPAPECVLLRRP